MSEFFHELFTNEKLSKYTVPGAFIMGGCMVFYTGYLLGSTLTKIKMPKESDPVPLQMSISTPDSVLSRVFSERSLVNSDYVDDLDRDSPSGDSYRCALIIRKDIRLTRGKTIIHSCRAFLAQFKKLYKQKDPDLKEWERDGMTVVALRVESESDFLEIKSKAQEIGVSSHVFVNKLADGVSVKTVMALGPSKTSMIKDLTRHLYRL